MSENNYQGQFYARDIDSEHGFHKIVDNGLINLFSEVIEGTDYVNRLGICAPPGTIATIKNGTNNEEVTIEIGKTGIYEVEDVKITGLSFPADTALDAIVDYIVIK